MATKQTIAQHWDGESMPTSTHLRIKGLKAVPGEDGVFELQGVRPRVIRHTLLAEALGYVDGEDPELEDKVLREVWRFDMVRLLTSRIEA